MTAYIEWLNQNAYRAYPLKEDTPRADVTGIDVSIPNNLMLDLILTVAGDPTVSVFLTQVSQVGGFLSMVFSDGSVTIATLAVDTNTHVPNTGYVINGQGDYEDARGRVVLGDLSDIRTLLPDGVYTFNAELEPGVVRPALRGVRSLRVVSGQGESDRITGNVKLVEGQNIQLTYLEAENAIRIDGIEGAGFGSDCDCDDQYEVPAIKRINGINAEDVEIIGDGKCLEVTMSGNTIKLTDTCSEPCCGCPELEFITDHLELLQAVLARLEELADTLQSRYQEFITAMLASTKGSG